MKTTKNTSYFFHIRSYIILFVLCFSFLKTNSQSVQGWYNAELNFDLPKGFDISTAFETRTNYDFGFQMHQFFPELGVGYKINKHFDFSMSYRYLMAKEDNGYFYSRNKLYTNLSFDFSIDRLTIKNRARYQIQSRNYIEDFEDAIPDKYFRNKLDFSYNIRKTPIEPYLSIEVYYPLNAYKVKTIDEYRFSAGIEFPVAKDHDMEVGILYNTERFPRPEKIIALLLSYSFSVN